MSDDFEMKHEYEFSKGIRGPSGPLEPGKTRITIRIDDEVLEWFRRLVHAAGGGNYQTEINRALQSYIARTEYQDDQSVVLDYLTRQVAAVQSRGLAWQRSSAVPPGWQQYLEHAKMEPAKQIPGSQP